MQDQKRIEWQLATVKSPHLADPVPVVVAKDIPYTTNANRLQNLSLYLPMTNETMKLIGKPVTSLPGWDHNSKLPRWHVHIHGGAWRDPQLTSTSIEAAAAHAFSDMGPRSGAISGIASLNYTLTKYPTHPTLPYDPIKDDHSDPAREAVHPAHVRDVVLGFKLLNSLGLSNGSFILSGHSCGACLAFQATLEAPHHWEIDDLPHATRPAALLGLNGLYDLPTLVDGLGSSHAQMRDDYDMFLSNAFGPDKSKWPAASPARFDTEQIARWVRDAVAPRLVVLDQSSEDQLVPMNQTERFEEHLKKVQGLKVVRGQRCTGRHAAPWEEGIMIWESVKDVLDLLEKDA